VVLFIGVARAMADDAPGWDIKLREQYTIGGWIEYLLALVALALIKICLIA